ncbi:hypothetical protein EBBID32_33720 [Sphingobium indicum BiD32]|uniref:Uncharacterized protein n=1 Tax=Sphingobium indicum BiD32 TaxID=1301087 RepID=N1MUH6_9SPHN|nr:hypothetical protein EBBID32_33720 [Sphingobium indicum BiD32]
MLAYRRQSAAADRQFLAALAACIRKTPVFRGFPPCHCVTHANWHGSCGYTGWIARIERHQAIERQRSTNF